jgi:uncharacterized protein (DUF885 family)
MVNYYKNYYEDNLKIDSQFSFFTGKRDKHSVAHYTNKLGNEYNKKLKKIYLKYIKYASNDIELKLELESIKKGFQYNLNLYFIIDSFENELMYFYYKNKNVYPKKYEKSRMNDFNKYMNSIIEKIKEGVKLKITVPYLICKNFLEQIEKINKFKKLYLFVKKNYLPKCRKTIGLCHLKNGKTIYRFLINKMLGMKKSPKFIHNLGLKLLKNSKLKKINNDNYKSREDFFEDCNRISMYVYNVLIDKYFHYKPKNPFQIKTVPESFEKSSSLAYYDPSENNVYINLYYYNIATKSSIHSLLTHECIHQYQYLFMKEYKLEQYQIFGYNNLALIEGFAHYMEIYVDNYDDYSNEYTLLRKVRLVVDTGINYYGWTYKKALNFMNKYLPKREKDNINEINRYICIPTQALCYTIGKYEIIKLRDKFLAQKRGTIKDFHHKLLINGAISFINLEKQLFL